MLSVGDWAEVRRLRRAERMSISEIARVLGISRNTVRAALASDAPPKYERKPAGSIVDPVEPRIRELLKAYPSMPATVIAERIGWTRPIRLPVGFGQTRKPAQLPVLTMVTGYSRWLSGQLIPTRAAADLFAGWWQLISQLGS